MRYALLHLGKNSGYHNDPHLLFRLLLSDTIFR